ncbi:MAG: Metal dependent phosphohydrolase [Methanoculleus marisnigri]|uniref:Metal dependent phosphohydrolase n=1 Tax=Methanoculleus marisnigri TaxID=2198 RepID=A0A124G687_9EURY|nr:MAG: Metal dependent phosphohydrolase [Methanoculleus marisnigri]
MDSAGAEITVLEKAIFVQGLREGMQVDAPFVVDAADLKEKRNGGKYIQLTISDHTGRGSCKVWGTPDHIGQIEAFYRAIVVGEVYRIQGYAKVYNGTCEVNVNDEIADLLAPLPRDGFDPSLFTYAPVDCDGVKRRLGSMVAKIEDPGIQSLVLEVIDNTPGFLDAPAAKRHHHAYIGGGAAALLRHSAGVDPSRFAHILHILMSHHGPHGEVQPRTPEAWTVHFADNAGAFLRGTCDDVEGLAPGEGRQGARTGKAVYRF